MGWFIKSIPFLLPIRFYIDIQTTTNMAGIYIHIPFCKTKCSYCSFYSATKYDAITEFTKSLAQEIKLQKNYLQQDISTIYFGGGTPTTLSPQQIEHILTEIRKNFTVKADAEITIEANPDDLSPSYLQGYQHIGINRLSIGVQTFDDTALQNINRRHTAKKALQAIENAEKTGYQNISIDLIYGLPNQTIQQWLQNINIATTLPIQHLSIYGLSYEEGTPLWLKLKKGIIQETDEETINRMYLSVVEKCQKKEFEQYEISNFAKQGYESRHNSAYWQQIPYLGLGPSAHSYDGTTRQGNVSSIKQYTKHIKQGTPHYLKEVLTKTDQINEYIMLQLRMTKNGIQIDQLTHLFGQEKTQQILRKAQKYIQTKHLIQTTEQLKLTVEGIMISNQIITDLME